jgi:hypothetical protein
MENPRVQGSIAFQAEFESEAFDNNLLRLELLHDGTSVYTSYNSKHEQTALSYVGQKSVAHA